jgi:hypothetical protein
MARSWKFTKSHSFLAFLESRFVLIQGLSGVPGNFSQVFVPKYCSKRVTAADSREFQCFLAPARGLYAKAVLGSDMSEGVGEGEGKEFPA